MLPNSVPDHATGCGMLRVLWIIRLGSGLGLAITLWSVDVRGRVITLCCGLCFLQVQAIPGPWAWIWAQDSGCRNLVRHGGNQRRFASCQKPTQTVDDRCSPVLKHLAPPGQICRGLSPEKATCTMSTTYTVGIRCASKSTTESMKAGVQCS